MNTIHVQDLIAGKGVRLVTHSRGDLVSFETVLRNPAITTYLTECLTTADYTASGVFMGGMLESLKALNSDLLPGACLFPHGLLSIARDVGGNTICVDSRTGWVFFADHGRFDDTGVSYPNPERIGEWIGVDELTYQSILKALIPLSTSFDMFLVDLLQDRLEDLLDELG